MLKTMTKEQKLYELKKKKFSGYQKIIRIWQT